MPDHHFDPDDFDPDDFDCGFHTLYGGDEECPRFEHCGLPAYARALCPVRPKAEWNSLHPCKMYYCHPLKEDAASTEDILEDVIWILIAISSLIMLVVIYLLNRALVKRSEKYRKFKEAIVARIQGCFGYNRLGGSGDGPKREDNQDMDGVSQATGMTTA